MSVVMTTHVGGSVPSTASTGHYILQNIAIEKSKIHYSHFSSSSRASQLHCLKAGASIQASQAMVT